MEAVILVGGLGTRLGDMVGKGNKPMMMIAGKPFLEYVLLQVRKFGMVDIVLCVGHRAASIERYFGDGHQWGLRLRYSHEQQLLGTAGAIRQASDLLHGERLFVLNGDSFFDVPLTALLDFHLRNQAQATLALAHLADRGRFGTVVTDRAGKVQQFTEKGQEPGAGLINAGIYVFERSVLDRIPAFAVASLEHDVFPNLIHHGLYGFAGPGYFVDIGVPSDVRQVQDRPGQLVAAVT